VFSEFLAKEKFPFSTVVTKQQQPHMVHVPLPQQLPSSLSFLQDFLSFLAQQLFVSFLQQFSVLTFLQTLATNGCTVKEQIIKSNMVAITFIFPTVKIRNFKADRKGLTLFNLHEIFLFFNKTLEKSSLNRYLHYSIPLI
jgi:hypothetical protein